MNPVTMGMSFVSCFAFYNFFFHFEFFFFSIYTQATTFVGSFTVFEALTGYSATTQTWVAGPSSCSLR